MFDFMYFVNSESDFETEHCMCDWLMNNLTDNSVLMNRTAVKSMISMKWDETECCDVVIITFSLFVQCDLALSAVIKSNS
jgi:hypothetical protein